jgi:hypothetical protein
MYFVTFSNATKITAENISQPFLLRIREILGSNFGPHIGYPVEGVSWFPSFPPNRFRDSTLNKLQLLCDISSV